MTPRPLGTTGLLVSPLGLGTVKFGRNTGVKYPTPFDLPSDRDILHLLDEARALGINLLDTAPAYGSSEDRLGQLLGTRRDEWVLSTKAGENYEDGQSSFDFSTPGILRSLENSLRRLRTDRVDILLLHSDGNDTNILADDTLLDTLRQLRQEGKTRAIGISTKTVEGGLRAIEAGLDLVMATYHPWHTAEAPVLHAAAEARTGIFIKKAFGSGWFGETGATGPEQDPVTTALTFIFQHPAVTAVISGTLNPDHLHHNAQVVTRAAG